MAEKIYQKKLRFEFRVRGDGWRKWRREGWIGVSISQVRSLAVYSITQSKAHLFQLGTARRSAEGVSIMRTLRLIIQTVLSTVLSLMRIYQVAKKSTTTSFTPAAANSG